MIFMRHHLVMAPRYATANLLIRFLNCSLVVTKIEIFDLGCDVMLIWDVSSQVQNSNDRHEMGHRLRSEPADMTVVVNKCNVIIQCIKMRISKDSWT